MEVYIVAINNTPLTPQKKKTPQCVGPSQIVSKFPVVQVKSFTYIRKCMMCIMIDESVTQC